MKRLIIIAIFLFAANYLLAQKDSSVYVENPANEFVQYIYNPNIKIKTLSYNYSNRWDFDNDGKNDSLVFIGNGGAHTYFYLRLKLTSEKSTRSYPTVQLDMPYITTTNDSLIIKMKHPAIQFVIGDFDRNQTTDIYLNFDNDFSQIPLSWKNAGITKKTVVLSYKSSEFIIQEK